MNKSSFLRRLAFVVSCVGLLGCTVHPAGEKEQRDAAGSDQPFTKPFEDREIQSLPDYPTPDQLVEFALLNSADLEQRYWEWRSAIEQIPQDATQSTTLNLSAGTSITNGHSGWESSTVALGNDPMTDIKWPSKLDAAAKQSLENAKAAGERFVQAKYELREKVLSAYDDYTLNAEFIRLEQSNRQLLSVIATVTEARSRAGSASQQDVLKAQNEIDLSNNDIAAMQSQLPAQRAAINALLGRTADAPLPLPTKLPPDRSFAFSDGELVELMAKQNPELSALANEIRAKHEGIRLAKLQFIPDFNLSAGTDLMGVTQSILGQATIPIFRYEALNAAIAQAEANLRASEAMLRQRSNDLAARVVADLAMIRDSDRQLDLFEHTILPRTQQVVAVGRSGYEVGQSTLLDLLDSQRSLIALHRLVANLRIVREKQLIDLEAIAGQRL